MRQQEGFTELDPIAVPYAVDAAAPSLQPALISSRLVGLLFAVGLTVEDLEDHSKIALGAEVGDLDAAELAA